MKLNNQLPLLFLIRPPKRDILWLERKLLSFFFVDKTIVNINFGDIIYRKNLFNVSNGYLVFTLKIKLNKLISVYNCIFGSKYLD